MLYKYTFGAIYNYWYLPDHVHVVTLADEAPEARTNILFMKNTQKIQSGGVEV